MRALVIGLLTALAVSSVAQSAGSYTSKGGTPQAWEINANHTLVWSGTPYLPVGLRVDGVPSEIARAKSAGFSDLIVDLPAGGTGWDEALKALDGAGMRYIVSINSLAPMAEGVTIEPSGYRVTGITKAQTLQVKLPGATSALAVIVNRRDSSVANTQRVPVLNGVMSLDVKPLADLEQVLLIYPKMRSLQQPDLWDALDEHRDRLLATLRNHPPGPGLRGILNPLGRLSSWDRNDMNFVPTSPYFHYEFAEYLKTRYRSLETAMKAWSMSASDIDSFDGLARLAPLWSGPRGVSQLWDTDTDKLYGCNQNRSQIWSDIHDAIAATAYRRYRHFMQAIHASVDVPIVQEWMGWLPIYESANPPIDGIGMRAFGVSPSDLLDSGCRATSSILRWHKAGWLFASDIQPGSDQHVADQLGNVLEDLTSLGARGWFLRSSSADLVKALAAQTARANDASLAQWSPSAVFFPENAYNPATPQRLPGGKWWLPSPANGNRLDLGDHFFGYRYDDGQPFTAIWTDLPAGRMKLKMMDGKNVSFTAIDGSLVDPKLSKDGVTINLGVYPVLISGSSEIPVPDSAYGETLDHMDQLLSAADSRLLDVTEPRFLFKDALAGFDRNPGGAFVLMRQQFAKVSLRLARYMWIEAEATRSNNFSEPTLMPGYSGGGYLSLRTQLEAPADGYYADYTVPVKSTDDVEIWIAARIPEAQRGEVSLTIAGDTFTLQGEPVSLYGQGFGWYKLGITRLGGVQTKMRLNVAGKSADMAFDCIVLMPGHFVPRGVMLPDAITFTQPKKKN